MWELVGKSAAWEYWLSPEGDVYRRRVSDCNYTCPDGTPSGLRWEGSRAWFEQHVSGMVAA